MPRDDTTEMLTGRVMWFGEKFGFLRADDGRRDLFFHKSALPAGILEVKAGERVTFILVPDPRRDGRVRAVNVEPIS
jgi:CspA family cold shock protein